MESPSARSSSSGRRKHSRSRSRRGSSFSWTSSVKRLWYKHRRIWIGIIGGLILVVVLLLIFQEVERQSINLAMPKEY